MKISNTIKICSTTLVLFLLSYSVAYATGITNNSFVFNGSSSSLKILDGTPVNGDASQSGFKYFNSSTASSNRKITIDTWVYLLGDNPGVLMPVITRSVTGGSSFSMYVKDGTAFFSVGNSTPVSTVTSFPSFPAFRWIRLTGTYDGQYLKIYYNGTLAESRSVTLSSPYTTGEGLFIAKYGSDIFKGLIDEVRIFNIALSSSQISSCSGNGNPSSSIPSALTPCLVGRWSFTEISPCNGTFVLNDLSTKKNHLRVTDITEVVKSNPLPFFVVNSNGDGADLSPGNGVADVGNGLVTLRSAIQEANALPNLQKIYFYLPGSQPFVIQPASALPTISGAVILDGTYQKGYSGLPLVEIKGIYGGVIISSGGSTIQGLTINNSSGYGLTLSSSGGNNVTANKISGILISSQGNNINGNTITGSTANGISIISGGLNNQIGVSSANNINANNGYGISVSGVSGNQLSNNVISTNNLGGIFISNSTAIVNGNTVTGNTGFGISINGGTGNQITNNIVSTNNGGGISLSNGTGSLTGNTITSNTGIGISVNSSTSNQITNNAVRTNTSGGIVITNSTGNIGGNTVTGNFGNGISLTTANSNTLTGNTVSENSGLGISVAGGIGNQLNNNTVEKDTLGGISILNSTASLTGNFVKRNFSNGISLSAANGTTLSGNTVSENSGLGISLANKYRKPI